MADYPGYPPAYPPADPYAQAYGSYAPPAPGAYHPAPYGGGAPYASDDVRTVFITGFPDDVKERELNNLLRFLPGYEASQMNRNKGQAQGFALFATGALGRAAIDALQHLRFDSDGSTLRCEMARKNMYIKDEPNPLKRPRYSSEPSPYAGYPPEGAPPGTGAPDSRPSSYTPGLNTKDNPPCNTLFVGNLGDTVSEPELQTFFSVHPGYRQLKLMKGPRNVTCFVEFEDLETAMAVHTSQQGAILTTSNRGGIRIQYSKNPLGRKRDASGAEILGPPGV